MDKLELTFRWNGEEAFPAKKQLAKIIEYGTSQPGDWILVADFLKDVMCEAVAAYEGFMALERKL